jgi:hypothetical protein
MRFYLGEKLYCMKELLAMCGRSEQWPAFLQKRGILLTIATQLVNEQEV